MFLLERYIMVETRRLVLTIIGFLIFIFASYSTQRYLTDAANGTLALHAVFTIVFYKVLIALEMLLPVGLYVAVAVALGRFYSDSEIVAMQAAGASPLRIYRAVLLLAIPLGILVTLLSMYARPWAWGQIFQLKQQSQSELDVSHLQAKKFNLSGSGRMVLAGGIDADNNRLSDALIYDAVGDKTWLFRARSVQVTNPTSASPSVELDAGSAWELDRTGTADHGQTYSAFTLHPKPIRPDAGVRSKSTSTIALARSFNPADKAELQWRQTRGISAVLMALLAAALSRVKPRQGRFATLLPLAVLFATIFYAGDICRTLVASRTLPAFPGVWLVPLMMLLLLMVLLAREFFLLQKYFR